MLRGDEFRALDADPRMIGVALGRDLRIGEQIACVLPGHEGRCWIEQVDGARLVYRCGCDQRRRSLADVYAARVTGVDRRRSHQEFVLWRVRLAAEAGMVALPDVVVMPLPPGIGNTATTTCHDALRLYLRVRALTEQRDEPEFTFAKNFVAEWSGLTPDETKTGIAGLRRCGVLVKCGTRPVGNYHANLYRLGQAVASNEEVS